MKYLAICPKSQHCWWEFKLGGFKLADIIIRNTNHRQTTTHIVLCARNAALATLHTVQLSITILQPWLPFSLISALLLDLRHVNLIPGNFVNVTTRTRPTQTNQIGNIPTGTVLPPFPTFLMEKLSQVHSSRWETLS